MYISILSISIQCWWCRGRMGWGRVGGAAGRPGPASAVARATHPRWGRRASSNGGTGASINHCSRFSKLLLFLGSHFFLTTFFCAIISLLIGKMKKNGIDRCLEKYRQVCIFVSLVRSVGATCCDVRLFRDVQKYCFYITSTISFLGTSFCNSRGNGSHVLVAFWFSRNILCLIFSIALVI